MQRQTQVMMDDDDDVLALFKASPERTTCRPVLSTGSLSLLPHRMNQLQKNLCSMRWGRKTLLQLVLLLWSTTARAFQPIPHTVSSLVVHVPTFRVVEQSHSRLFSTPTTNKSIHTRIQKKPDPYRVLGLPRDATVEQAKSSYRKLAKAYHPDANPEEERETITMLFQTIQESYKVVLSQARLRLRREQTRKVEERMQQALEHDKEPFVRLDLDLDRKEHNPSPPKTTTTCSYDTKDMPSSPTDTEHDARASPYPYRRPSATTTTRNRPTRMTTPSNSNSPHRDWPEPFPGDWSTTTTYYHRNNNSNSHVVRHQRPYQPPPPPRPSTTQSSTASNIRKQSDDTTYPPRRGPSWSRPRPANFHVQANNNGVDGPRQRNHHPYAESTSSRPNSSSSSSPPPYTTSFAQYRPTATTQRPPRQTSTSTPTSSTSSSSPKKNSSSRRNQQRPRQYFNEDYFANDSTGQNSPLSLHKRCVPDVWEE